MTKVKKEALYTSKLDEAFALAADAFRHTARKGTGIPYLTHLAQVYVYVAEHGGDEDQQIAALLHDYLEDIEGASAAELEARFGARVARLVAALSDTTTHPKPPWKERKEAYLAHLAHAPAEVKLISAADKLHNARSILRDYATQGEALWERFTASRFETLWYYRQVVEALGRDWSHPLLDRLAHEVRHLHEVTGATRAIE